jgi:hypothetical protein
MVSSLKTRVLRELTVVLVFPLVFYFKISTGNPMLNILQLNERAAGRCVRASVMHLTTKRSNDGGSSDIDLGGELLFGVFPGTRA